jgi:hypothetical protein
MSRRYGRFVDARIINARMNAKDARVQREAAARAAAPALGPGMPYQLPDGRIVAVPVDVCQMRNTINYTLADGRIVTALRVMGGGR